MTLDLSKVSDTYFNKLFVSKGAPADNEMKSKVLLLDSYTTSIISMCYSQSQLLQNDIVLIELIDNYSFLSTMKHLNCVIYIRPCKNSIRHLVNELRSPHFGRYSLYFNNTVSKGQLEEIADADEFELVYQVLELYQDYFIVNNNLYTTNVSGYEENAILDESHSLLSLLLAIKKCPIIKYESSSIDLKRLSSEIVYYINSNSNNNLFEDLNKESDIPPLLLLLDRRNDPITPLITPWTYQSMIHELIGIEKNVVNLKDSGEQVILNESQDFFFHDSRYLNYGELTDKFQKYVDKYKSQTQQTSADNLKTQNLSELKKVLTKFPEYKKMLNNILKHLNIISELDNKISLQNLWEISELQQTIVCDLDNHQAIKSKMLEILDNNSILTIHKVKLILLYSYKFYSNKKEMLLFTSKLKDPSLTQPPPTLSQLSLIKTFGKQFERLATDFSDSGGNNIGAIFNSKRINISLLFNSRQNRGTNNVFMQYIPKLNNLLEKIINKSSTNNNDGEETKLTTLTPDAITNQYGHDSEQVQDIIIYIKGGVSYEEARLIHDLAITNPKVNLLIGGDTILNSEQWLNKLYDMNNENTQSV